jgi:DNA-binding transcriptional ArsR family regulator
LNSDREGKPMRVIDLAGRSPAVTVEVDAAPAYELLMSLVTFSHQAESEGLDVGPAWFERIRATASPDLLSAIARFALHGGTAWCHLLGLAYESAPPKDVATFLARLDATEPVELRLHMLGYYIHDDHSAISPDVMRQAARGDVAAQQEVSASAHLCDAADQETLQHLFSLTPEETKRHVLEMLRAWHSEVFRDQEPTLMPILARDAAAKRRLIGTMPVERLVDLATNGVQYTPEAGIRRVILIPQVTFRPWVLISGHRDARIFCYAVADESLAADTEPASARLVRLYKALADERRLQILKKLATESCTLQEMADSLGVGKSLMHHHVTSLRAAGLVRCRMGADKRYELRHDALADMPGLLDLYLKGQPDETVPRANRSATARRRARGSRPRGR